MGLLTSPLARGGSDSFRGAIWTADSSGLVDAVIAHPTLGHGGLDVVRSPAGLQLVSVAAVQGVAPSGTPATRSAALTVGRTLAQRQVVQLVSSRLETTQNLTTTVGHRELESGVVSAEARAVLATWTRETATSVLAGSQDLGQWYGADEDVLFVAISVAIPGKPPQTEVEE